MDAPEGVRPLNSTMDGDSTMLFDDIVGDPDVFNAQIDNEIANFDAQQHQQRRQKEPNDDVDQLGEGNQKQQPEYQQFAIQGLENQQLDEQAENGLQKSSDSSITDPVAATTSSGVSAALAVSAADNSYQADTNINEQRRRGDRSAKPTRRSGGKDKTDTNTRHSEFLKRIWAETQQREQQYIDKTLPNERERLQRIRSEKLGELERLAKAHQMRQIGPSAMQVVFGPGYMGYGNGASGLEPRIVSPRQRKRPRNRPLLLLSRRALRKQAEQIEELVPIRIELESDRFRIKDTLTWNSQEKQIDLASFAEILCLDFCLPPQPFFKPAIAKAISDQVAAFHPHLYPEISQKNINEPNKKCKISADSAASADANGASASSAEGAVATTVSKTERDSRSQLEAPSQAESEEVREWNKYDEDLRIIIKVDIVIGQYNLQDSFEWDINTPENVAEDFARTLCDDLGLQREFQTAVAHEIREQCQLYTNALYLVGYQFDGRVVEDDYIRTYLMPTVFDVLRDPDAISEFTPSLLELDDDDLDKLDRDLEREIRRKRRQTRAVRRGTSVPDLTDIPKTMRTHILHSVLDVVDPLLDRNGIHRPGIAGLDDDDEWENQSNSGNPHTRHRSATVIGQHLPSLSPASFQGSQTTRERVRMLHQHQQKQQQQMLHNRSPSRGSYNQRQTEPAKPTTRIDEPSFIVTLKVPSWKYHLRVGSLKDATTFRGRS